MWGNLKSSIASVIQANSNQEITGNILQSVLFSIINNVGENASFAGVATTTTNPGIPEGPVFYIAVEKGIYPNFNSINILGLSVINYDFDSQTWKSDYICDLENEIYYCEAAEGSLDFQTEIPGYIISSNKFYFVKFGLSDIDSQNATLNINNTGAKQLYYNSSSIQSYNKIEAGEVVLLCYDSEIDKYQTWPIMQSLKREFSKILGVISANVDTLQTIINKKGIFDVSEYNKAPGGTLAKYSSLQAAIASIPENNFYPGMMIKFLCNNHDKDRYVIRAIDYGENPDEQQQQIIDDATHIQNKLGYENEKIQANTFNKAVFYSINDGILENYHESDRYSIFELLRDADDTVYLTTLFVDESSVNHNIVYYVEPVINQFINVDNKRAWVYAINFGNELRDADNWISLDEYPSLESFGLVHSYGIAKAISQAKKDVKKDICDNEKILYAGPHDMGSYTMLGEGVLSPSLFFNIGIETGNSIVVRSSGGNEGHVQIIKLVGDEKTEVIIVDSDIDLNDNEVSYTLTAEDVAALLQNGMRLKGNDFILENLVVKDTDKINTYSVDNTYNGTNTYNGNNIYKGHNTYENSNSHSSSSVETWTYSSGTSAKQTSVGINGIEINVPRGLITGKCKVDFEGIHLTKSGETISLDFEKLKSLLTLIEE